MWKPADLIKLKHLYGCTVQFSVYGMQTEPWVSYSVQELFAVCDDDGAHSQEPERLIDRRRVIASRAPRRSDLLAITSTPSPFPLLLAGFFSNALGGVGTSASQTPVEVGRVAGTNQRALTHTPPC